eukprot:Awhi_evm1s396
MSNANDYVKATDFKYIVADYIKENQLRKMSNRDIEKELKLRGCKKNRRRVDGSANSLWIYEGIYLADNGVGM